MASQQQHNQQGQATGTRYRVSLEVWACGACPGRYAAIADTGHQRVIGHILEYAEWKSIRSAYTPLGGIMKRFFSLAAILFTAGCATIVNDPTIPLAMSFSDGSAGKCNFRNKRGAWSSDIPTTNLMIRRSDDALVYDCETSDGRKVTGSIRSEIEGEKTAASIIFWDFGITDSITDKHRTYQGNVVIPVAPVSTEPATSESSGDDAA